VTFRRSVVTKIGPDLIQRLQARSPLPAFWGLTISLRGTVLAQPADTRACGVGRAATWRSV
jgi:hypothetical protein